MDSVGLQVHYCLIEIMRNVSNTYFGEVLTNGSGYGVSTDVQRSIYINVQKEGKATLEPT